MSQQQTLTKTWTRCSGTLKECLQKATGLYYQTREDQGNQVWHVLVPGLEIGRCEKNVFAPQELLERIKTQPEATKQAIFEYDTDWDGEIDKVSWMDGQKDAHIWTFAKLYLEGKNDPVALIYHIDYEDEEEDDYPEE